MRYPIIIQNLAIGYGNLVVVSGIDLVISENDFVVIIGPNGGGKTTFVKTILGIIPPLRGVVEVLGCPVGHVCPHRKRIGYVPQMGRIPVNFPATLLDVVLSGLYPYLERTASIGKAEKELALRLLEEFGLKEKAYTLFGHLSGGQQKRGLVARALIGHPDVLIFDEPTSGVDIAAATEFRQKIVEIYKSRHIPIILITHDLNPYLPYLTKLVIIGRGKFRAGDITLLEDEAFLKSIYGEGVKVLKINGKYYLISGDFHNV